VLTKIDLPTADPEPVLNSVEQTLGLSPESVLWTSAKSGAGIGEILPAVIARMPPPSGSRAAPLRCLLFDSWYNEHRGVVCLIQVRTADAATPQVVDGTIRPGMQISSAATSESYSV
jgi:translation elongation factor EF-4